MMSRFPMVWVKCTSQTAAFSSDISPTEKQTEMESTSSTTALSIPESSIIILQLPPERIRGTIKTKT